MEFSILDSVPDERLGDPTLTVLVGGTHEDFAYTLLLDLRMV